jgi:hypothetical protein
MKIIFQICFKVDEDRFFLRKKNVLLFLKINGSFEYAFKPANDYPLIFDFCDI